MAFTDRLGNRGSISTGYDIDNSCVFEGANNEWMYRSSPTAGDRKTFTFSFWFKRSESKDAIVVWQGTHGRIRFQNDDIRLRFASGHELETSRKIRDYAAWYHLVIACDTTQGTAANRVKMYVNGVQETAFETATYPDQNDDSDLMSTSNLYISAGDGDFDYSGYIAEFNLIDGTQYAASDFGETDEDSGIWVPKKFTGTYGDEGVYLKFDSSGSLGADSSGNSNTFTLNNIDSGNQTTDTPSNNFCIPFVDQYYDSSDSISHSQGGTTLTTASGTGWRTNMATMSVSSGKWYFEAKHPGTIDGDAIMTSIVPTARFTNSSVAGFYGGMLSGDGIGFYWDSTRFRYDDFITISPPTNTINSDDILSIALDMDNNYVYSRINGGAWHNNGTDDGDPTSGSSGTGGFAVADEPHMICTSMYHPIKTFHVNFGGYAPYTISSAATDENGYGTFEYAVPDGYYALCTKNIAEYG